MIPEPDRKDVRCVCGAQAFSRWSVVQDRPVYRHRGLMLADGNNRPNMVPEKDGEGRLLLHCNACASQWVEERNNAPSLCDEVKAFLSHLVVHGGLPTATIEEVKQFATKLVTKE